MRRGLRGAVLVAILAPAVLAGCRSTARPRPGDGFFDAGDFAGAAAAYEALVERSPGLLRDDPELAYRLAVCHGVPGHSGSDPERARELLGPLLEHAGLRAPAMALAALLDEVEHLEWRRGELVVEVEALAGRLRQCESAAAACDGRLADEREQVDRLRARAEALAVRVEALRAELEAIKRIDLEPPR